MHHLAWLLHFHVIILQFCYICWVCVIIASSNTGLPQLNNITWVGHSFSFLFSLE